MRHACNAIDRRAALLAVGSAAVCCGVSSADAQPRKPDFSVPDGACDCHVHIYDPRFPYQPNARLRPTDATLADYKSEVQSVLRTTRAIFVTPSTYGTDNRCLTDALAQCGGSARGVAVVDPGITPAELGKLHDAGVRGVRVKLPKEQLVALSHRLHPLGWHMEFYLPGDTLIGMEETLRSLPTPIVLDHLAHLREPQAQKSPAFKTVRRLLDAGNCWIKCSGPYIDSTIGPPDYPDSSELAKAFIAAAPERCLWATNWPFPDITAGEKRVPRPDALPFLNLFGRWVTDTGLRKQILVSNPEALYGFQSGQTQR
jgi:predicted TIM-barrel fold metal-dependent hydrolase